MLSAIRSVHIVKASLDMRRSFDGLLVAARHLGFEPYDGSCLVFLSRSRHILKAVVGDDKGLMLLCRRFEGGALPRLIGELLAPETRRISQAQLLFLFEGCTFEVRGEAPRWRVSPAH